MAELQQKPVKAWMSWSSGKDSAYAFYKARMSGKYEITALLTTVTEAYGRVSMHGVRLELLQAQADAVGLPLVIVNIPAPCSNSIYEERMRTAMDRARSEGVQVIIFGDLFLQDIRDYREQKMQGTGIGTAFPLWKRPTKDLAAEMIAAGVKCVVVCLDPKRVAKEIAGKLFTTSLVEGLPTACDPCAENGEFHTFAFGGPMFKAEIPIQVGQTVEREGFVFTDVLLKKEDQNEGSN